MNMLLSVTALQCKHVVPLTLETQACVQSGKHHHGDPACVHGGGRIRPLVVADERLKCSVARGMTNRLMHGVLHPSSNANAFPILKTLLMRKFLASEEIQVGGVHAHVHTPIFPVGLTRKNHLRSELSTSRVP